MSTADLFSFLADTKQEEDDDEIMEVDGLSESQAQQQPNTKNDGNKTLPPKVNTRDIGGGKKTKKKKRKAAKNGDSEESAKNKESRRAEDGEGESEEGGNGSVGSAAGADEPRAKRVKIDDQQEYENERESVATPLSIPVTLPVVPVRSILQDSKSTTSTEHMKEPTDSDSEDELEAKRQGERKERERNEPIFRPVVVDEFETEARREVSVVVGGADAEGDAGDGEHKEGKEKEVTTTPPGLVPSVISSSTAAVPPHPIPQPSSSEITTLVSAPTTSTSQPAGHKITLSHLVQHQVAIPPSYPYVPIAQHVPPAKPAKTYPFTLDPFQEVAIHAIQRDESVLVSAHTSAGKTVVAEYAIAQAMEKKERVVYTSPIKALSNQKYRELLAEFGDVGLMTGDVTINPNATCLVMTTEILRSMLYHPTALTISLHTVIFDEVHYMRDPSRGIIWEECILLLPPPSLLIFLSATIPNSLEFAQWITAIKGRPTHVVYTTFRPTPLRYYVFPEGGEGIYLVVDEGGKWKEGNWERAVGVLNNLNDTSRGEDPASERSGNKRKGKSRKGGMKSQSSSDLQSLTRLLMHKSYNPIICFSFSKREVEANALSISSSQKNLSFTSQDEQDLITQIFTNALATLSTEDQNLPQITSLLPLLKKGIGIHHSGLLPPLKELIELLFGEGLLKVLFATETFSIGLNMPAKTVVFSGIRKWDGKGFRWLRSGEFVQMSGRAGRRGIDERGVVVVCMERKMFDDIASSAEDGADISKSLTHSLQQLLTGTPDPLDSAFRLGWNMLLNLMRVEGVSPEWVMERCFLSWQKRGGRGGVEDALKKTESRLTTLRTHFASPQLETQIEEYFDIRRQLAILGRDFREVVTHPGYVLPFLQVGRLVRVKVRKVKAEVDTSGRAGYKNGKIGEGVKKIKREKKVKTENGTKKEEEGEMGMDDLDEEFEDMSVDGEEDDEEDWGWGVVVNWLKRVPASGKNKPTPSSTDDLPPHEQYVVDVLLNIIPPTSSSTSFKSDNLTGLKPTPNVRPCPWPPSSSHSSSNSAKDPLARTNTEKVKVKGEPHVLPVLLSTIAGVSHLRIFLPKDLRSSAAKETAWKSVLEVHRRFPEGIGMLDPVKHMGIKDKKFGELIEKISTLEKTLLSHPLHTSPSLPELYTLHLRKRFLQQRIRSLKSELAETSSILHLDELKARKRVLRRLGFITKDDVVDIKGRVACEISAGDELLVTEMIFQGVWNGVEPEVCAALASCFVFSEKSEHPTKLKEELAAPLRSLQEIAKRIAKVCKESKMEIDERDYVQSFKVELMDAVIQWCRGATFMEICKLTDQFEGSLIRIFRRLAELLRQLKQAATVIGNKELEAKFEKASEMLERPNSIIFCASLYL